MNKYLIVSNSDIGAAVASHLRKKGATVFIASRTVPADYQEHHISIDYQINSDYQKLAEIIVQQKIKVLISTLGILHDNDHTPEKSISEITEAWFMKNMEVNCFYNLNLLSQLTVILPRSTSIKCVIFSARVGSISDNRLGGWLSYRTSKAALNMVIRTVAIEWKRLFSNAVIVGYHPGTVITKLSKPYIHDTTTYFSLEKAAEKCVQFIDNLSPLMSGQIYDWRQELIPF